MKSTKPKPLELTPKKALIKSNEKNRVVLIFIILSLGLLTSALINFILAINNFSLAREKKIYVEQLDGTTLTATEEDHNFRDNKVISETVINWLYLNWEWDARIPNSDELDRGINLKDKIDTNKSMRKIPTRTYMASYLLESGFRQEFLKKMSEIIPPSVLSGHTTSNLKIYHVGQPQRLTEDTYQIQVIATRIDLASTGELAQTDFNRTYVLKTISPYRLVLGEDEPSAFRKQLNQLLKNGLIITSIK